MNQLEIHKKIDNFFSGDLSSASVETATALFTCNDDAKRYFFSRSTEKWLNWLWENDFLVALSKKVADTTTYSYRLPELEYLTRMAEKEPEMVADIIISIDVSEETFNPEVLDRFFWITGLLPADQIKKILPKILREGWVKLMSAFNRSGYEYQKIVEKLTEAKDYGSLNILCRIIFTVRSKEEFGDNERFSISDKFFYLHDVTATGIFDAITGIDNDRNEESLKIFSEILTDIVNLGINGEETVFSKTEPFYLLDVNIFKLSLDSSKRSHMREDIQNFVASCKELVRNVLDLKSNDESEIKKIYKTYIASLPDSLTCWRLKLYAITRYPEFFKEEIKENLFRVFNVGDRHHELDSGAEYHEALIAGFGAIDDPSKREYIANVIKYYGSTLDDHRREEWRKRDGLEIVTYIKNHLTPDEVIASEKVFGKILEDGKIKPHPSMGEITSGFVTQKTPFNPGDFTIEKLVAHLKTDASPSVLEEKYKNDDFFNRHSVEGLGDAIRDDFKERKSEYLLEIDKFFDRESIYSGYLYSILRAIEELLREKYSFTNEEYLLIINFFDLIRESGETKEFEKPKERSSSSDWITVHKVAADILLDILAVIKDNDLFKENKLKILAIIKYLLSIKSSPDVEDEKREDSESSHVAINSVRGQAYRAFVQFTYNEGKNLSDEAKILYEYILDTDSSNAVRYTIGQFFASFYFRDIEFIKSMLPKIFPKDEVGKEKLYFATWEGYLASSLYKEVFLELEPYYESAIKTGSEKYPDRRYDKGLDETLAIHLALAYAHFDFKIGDPLFELFWNTPSENRHYEFVSFIGRTCLTRSQAGDDWFKENRVNKEKLITFWDWIITTATPVEPKAFSGFGFWINPDKEVIDEKIIIKNLPATLEKSNGEVDWDYGLTKRISKFAEIDPLATLEVIRRFLLLDDGLNPHRRAPLFSIDRDIKEALVIIYENTDFKKEVEELINLLIEKGSSVFWDLKEVIKQ